MRTTPLVDRATFASATIDTAGAVTVAYAFDQEASEAGGPSQRANLARLDGSGRLLWNQNLDAALGVLNAPPAAATHLAASPLAILDGAGEGESLMLVSRVAIDGAPRGDLLVRVDADGSVAWTHELDSSQNRSAWPLTGGGVVLSHLGADGELVLDWLDAKGRPLQRTQFPAVPDRVVTSGADSSGRVFLTGALSPAPSGAGGDGGEEADDSAALLVVVSEDGTVCSRTRVDLPPPEVPPGAPLYAPRVVARGGSRVYIATASAVALLTIPEAP